MGTRISCGYRSKAPSVVLGDFNDALVGKYGEKSVKKQGRSINVDFGVHVDADDNTDYRIMSVDAVGADPEPTEDGTNPTANETIDASVFKRWRADPKYRPDNLVEWVHRKNVDPAQLQTSVEAGNPQVSVPDQ